MTNIPATQIAVVATGYGPARQVLQLQKDFPVPKAAELKPTEVLVKIQYASTNPVDGYILFGAFKAHAGELAFPVVTGCDGSGIVVAVGSGVTDFKVGEEVFGNTRAGVIPGKAQGTFEQFAVFDQSSLSHKPKQVSFKFAASVNIALGTAYEGLVKYPFKTILITGASGGVGSFAVLLAKHYFKAGKIFATASAKNVDYVRALGADVVINHETEDFTSAIKSSGIGKVDLVLDLYGKGALEPLIAIGAKYLTPARFLTGKPDEPKFEVYYGNHDGKLLAKLVNFLVEESLVDKVQLHEFTLEHTGEALEMQLSTHVAGKIVIAVP